LKSLKRLAKTDAAAIDETADDAHGEPPERMISQKRPRLIGDAHESSRDLETPRPSASPFLVPKLKMDPSEIVELPLDHRAGFLLSLIDGKTNVQTIVDISGMPEQEVTDILEDLLLFGVIGPK
jgi:hypothetical protein